MADDQSGSSDGQPEDNIEVHQNRVGRGDRSEVNLALLQCLDERADSWSPEPGTAEILKALQEDVVPQNLVRTTADGERVLYDQHSLIQALRDLCGTYNKNPRYRKTKAFVPAGSWAIMDSHLKVLGYESKRKRPQDEDLENTQRARRRRPEELSRNRPARTPNGDSNGIADSSSTAADAQLTESGVSSSTAPAPAPKANAPAPKANHPKKRADSLGSKSDQTTSKDPGSAQPNGPNRPLRNKDHSSGGGHSIALKVEKASPSRNLSPGRQRSLEPMLDLPADPQESSQEPGQQVQPLLAEPSSRTATANGKDAHHTMHTHVQQNVAEGAPAQVQNEPGLLPHPVPAQPYLGSFSVASDQIRGDLTSLFRHLEQAVQSEFEAAGLDIAEPASFEVKPTPELQKLYQHVLGTKDWKSCLAQLQADRKPRAFDAFIATVSAAFHLWIFHAVQPWQGPCKERLGTALHRKHVADTVLKHTGFELDTLLRLAAVEELQDVQYHREEMLPVAWHYATDLSLVLAQHISRLRMQVTPGAVRPFGAEWERRLVDAFFNSLLLAGRLRLASEQYVFKWYASGQDFDRRTMTTRYPADKQQKVCMSMFPGVQMLGPQKGPVREKEAFQEEAGVIEEAGVQVQEDAGVMEEANVLVVQGLVLSD